MDLSNICLLIHWTIFNWIILSLKEFLQVFGTHDSFIHFAFQIT